jgi:hypothetical protein
MIIAPNRMPVPGGGSGGAAPRKRAPGNPGPMKPGKPVVPKRQIAAGPKPPKVGGGGRR